MKIHYCDMLPTMPPTASSAERTGGIISKPQEFYKCQATRRPDVIIILRHGPGSELLVALEPGKKIIIIIIIIIVLTSIIVVSIFFSITPNITPLYHIISLPPSRLAQGDCTSVRGHHPDENAWLRIISRICLGNARLLLEPSAPKPAKHFQLRFHSPSLFLVDYP